MRTSSRPAGFAGPCRSAGEAYLTQVFFLSGVTKLRDWETTLALFADDYQVPLLSPALAAALGKDGDSYCPCCSP
ncbi:MAG: hypothetical protein ACK5PE_03075 [bacterium]